ncbi:hypothetical protein Csa_017449 [Cucumis sativus]|uniref:Uncharacterized protein n=1 Tax=Cucumis sativus TaxID=3659 RepID=A0A0A0L8Q4_CUCSA|nr:hypothetical protein Csa_017449 [Cucumis sativus]
MHNYDISTTTQRVLQRHTLNSFCNKLILRPENLSLLRLGIRSHQYHESYLEYPTVSRQIYILRPGSYTPPASYYHISQAFHNECYNAIRWNHFTTWA